ncbi:PREDICTED: ribosomal RNA processing protein 1 homolog [Papilio xuthus]|uniref:Ribosomal RNA processing protein 1 homolog n=1 Tax=Papilio xuthus TaxID=66420 RepID=A0AAJ6ZPY0_PAPXU|nr:PREDICTED: ribosomal RNA processing protein 1 homolog [Papilio xuthus]
MKTNNKKKTKKQKSKNRPIVKNKKERILVIAQEFKFAKLLSSNEKKTRDRVLKALKKWLLNCFEKGYEFKEDDFFRVWKGLFYAVWMSDKPLIQEELCENIAGILDQFPPEQIKNAALMTKAGFKMLATGWYGIDQHRIDKFMMLVRRYLRGSLRCLLRCKWSLESCNIYTEMLTAEDGLLAVKTPTYARNALSLILHFIDCFLEELAKISQGKIPDESIVCLLRPFCLLVCGGEGAAVNAARSLLNALLYQSDFGLQYAAKKQAWQKMGCPPGGPDALEMVIEDGDEENDENDEDDNKTESGPVLDPRAGKVNVELAQLPVPSALLAEELRRLADTVSRTHKACKRAKACIESFVQLSNNVYPLRIKNTDFLADLEEAALPKPLEAAKQLKDLEKRLATSADELALRGLSRKHRKRLLAKSRAGLSIVEDVVKPDEVPAESTNGDWNIEETKSDDKQKKENDTSNKKPANKKRPNKKRKLEEKTTKVENVKKVKTDKKEQTQKHSEIKMATAKMNGDSKPKQKLKKDNIKKMEVDKDKEKGKDKTQVAASKKKDNLVNKENSKNNAKTISEKKNTETQKVKEKPSQKPMKATLVVNKVKNNKNKISPKTSKSINAKLSLNTPKKVKFVLKNNGAQAPVDYYKSVRQSPNIPFDSSKQPTKTNLKPSTPSPINPFFKKKLRLAKM